MDFLSRRQLVRGSLVVAGLSLCSGCGVLPVLGQQPVRVPRIGYLALSPADAEYRAFRDGLRDLGYVEGRTIATEERWAESSEQFPALAVELTRLPVDLIIAAAGTPAIRAAMGATRTIPIVFAGAGDPVGSGFVDSLAKPGGNVTGLSSLQAQLNGKRLELLREMVPGISRVVYLNDTVASQATGGFQGTQPAAQSLGVQLLTPTIGSAADLPAAFELTVAEQVEAIVVGAPALMTAERGRIVEFATAARLPLIAPARSFPEAGGLSSYGPNRLALYRRAAGYVDKILKGAKPADLPVEQPTEFDFVINLKTARALGLTLPESILQQATEVIQ